MIEFKEKYKAEPIFVRLFEIALPHIKDFMSDLGHDTLVLAVATPGDEFLWSYRPTGTWLTKMGEDNRAKANIWTQVHDSSTALLAWHYIYVTEKGFDIGQRNGLHAPYGYVIPLNLKTRLDIIDFWNDVKRNSRIPA